MNDALQGASQFNNMRIAAIGDSITNGYNGYYDLTSDTYPEWLGKYLNTKVDNYGVNAASISDEVTEDGDMSAQVDHNIDFEKYQVAVLFYGTNDWRHSAHSLKQVVTALEHNLNLINQKQPHLKMYAILPLRRYDNGKCSDNVKGIGGYTMNQLGDALKRVYQKHHVPCFDWRVQANDFVNENNYKIRLQDQHLHPTPKTYRMMAKIIAEFMIKNY